MSHHNKFAFSFLPHSNKQNENCFFHFPPNSNKKKKKGMDEGSLFYFSVPNMHALRNSWTWDLYFSGLWPNTFVFFLTPTCELAIFARLFVVLQTQNPRIINFSLQPKTIIFFFISFLLFLSPSPVLCGFLLVPSFHPRAPTLLEHSIIIFFSFSRLVIYLLSKSNLKSYQIKMKMKPKIIFGKEAAKKPKKTLRKGRREERIEFLNWF